MPEEPFNYASFKEVGGIPIEKIVHAAVFLFQPPLKLNIKQGYIQ